MSEADKIFAKLNSMERLFIGAWLWNNGLYKKFDKARAEYDQRSRLYKFFNPTPPRIQHFMLMDYPPGGNTPRVERLMKLTKD